MPFELTLVLSPRQASDPAGYVPVIARQLQIPESRIAHVRIVRRSIDARKKNVRINLGVIVYVDQQQSPEPVHFDYPYVEHATPVIVVGSGPAGLFAALRLIERGLRPLIVERGREVSRRKRDIAQINRNGPVDPHSNYAFGEGGAGTFSDGKLFTRSKKRGDYRKALELFHAHGADESILYDAHPHIGTDRLPRIISAIRQTILQAGGVFLFESPVTGLKIVQGRITGVTLADTTLDGAAVILATGHSARDMYEILHRHNVLLEAKPFAMGVRVEHPQNLIDSAQYHTAVRDEFLPAATYTLAEQVAGRGVYSFCMCPGGFIVPAMTRSGESVVNGMSPQGRNSVYANAGIVTEIRLSDFEHLRHEHGPLAGMHFQQQLETSAYHQVVNGQRAPAQRITDFIAHRASPLLPQCSYVPGVTPSRIDQWMPPFMAEALLGGFLRFNQQIKGFITDQAIVLGVESRTSSPVRIPRDPNLLMHPQVQGLFPAGEGAGYAGGIISAALDGERCADCAADYVSKSLVSSAYYIAVK